MIIKGIYLLISAFMVVAGLLRKKITNKDKALAYLTFTISWVFGIFGIALMFENGESKPSDVLFYVAVVPVLMASVWLIKSIK